MQTEVYSSGFLSSANVPSLVDIPFKRQLLAGVRVILTYGRPNMQTGVCMDFVIKLTRGTEESNIVASLTPGRTKQLHLGTFDFSPGDRITVSASSIDPDEGEVAATVLIDVG